MKMVIKMITKDNMKMMMVMRIKYLLKKVPAHKNLLLYSRIHHPKFNTSRIEENRNNSSKEVNLNLKECNRKSIHNKGKNMTLSRLKCISNKKRKKELERMQLRSSAFTQRFSFNFILQLSNESVLKRIVKSRRVKENSNLMVEFINHCASLI